MSRAGHSLRWAGLALVGAVLAFAASILVPVSSTASLEPSSLPADGSASARLIWSADSLYGQPVPVWPWEVSVKVISGHERLRLVGKGRMDAGQAHLELGLVPTGSPGPAEIELSTGRERKRFVLRIDASDPDRDADGMPDRAELIDPFDRRAFRNWFTTIAESQFYAPDPRWDPVHRDCAGLARFAYKEALRRHDSAWLAATPYLHAPGGPDVRRFSYPEVPTLGTRLFRTSGGPYRPSGDPESQFSASASAQVLWEHNTEFLGRRPTLARPGDLLFFRHSDHPSAPMHTMILLDPPGVPGSPRVVYHTGADGDDPGEVRLVRLDALAAHADDRWHPNENNPDFLGYYRWKILALQSAAAQEALNGSRTSPVVDSTVQSATAQEPLAGGRS